MYGSRGRGTPPQSPERADRPYELVRLRQSVRELDREALGRAARAASMSLPPGQEGVVLRPRRGVYLRSWIGLHCAQRWHVHPRGGRQRAAYTRTVRRSEAPPVLEKGARSRGIRSPPARHIRNSPSVPVSGARHAHRFRARRRRSRPPHRPRLRGDGQRQRVLPRCARALDRRRIHRRAPRSGWRGRRRRVPPSRRRPGRGDGDLRRGLHEHADRAGGGRAGARPSRARRGRRAHLGPPPVGRRPDRAGVGGRRAHLHGGPSGCRGHDRHRDRARAHLPGADRARDPLRRRGARGGAGAAGAGAAAAGAGRARAARSPSRRSATSPPPWPERSARCCWPGARRMARRRRRSARRSSPTRPAPSPRRPHSAAASFRAPSSISA